MSEKPSKEGLAQQPSQNRASFEVSDELLDGIVGGYDPNAYNPAAVAKEMKAVIANAKQSGMSREEAGEVYIASSVAVYAQFGPSSKEYQLEMDKYRYLVENWDIL